MSLRRLLFTLSFVFFLTPHRSFALSDESARRLRELERESVDLFARIPPKSVSAAQAHARDLHRIFDSIRAEAIADDTSRPTAEKVQAYLRLIDAALAVPQSDVISVAAAISGRVTDATTGTAIMNATVYATRDGEDWPEVQARTDSNGDYVLHTASASFRISASAPGKTMTEYPSLVSPTWESPVTGVNVALPEGGSISGRVTDDLGTPIYATVQLWELTRGYQQHIYTDAEGKWTTGNLLSLGTYFVLISGYDYRSVAYPNQPCDYCDPRAVGTPIVYDVPGRHITGIDTALQPDGDLRVTLVDDHTGKAVQYGRVELFRTDGSYVGSDYLYNEETRAWFDVIAGMQYRVKAYGDDYTAEYYDNVQCNPTCDPNNATPIPMSGPPVNITMRLSSLLMTVRGRVVDQRTGAPISRASVRAIGFGGYTVRQRYSDANGEWGFAIPESGGSTVLLEASHPLFRNERYDGLDCAENCSGGTSVTLTPGTSLSDVNFTLLPASMITGVIRDSDGSPATAQVTLLATDGTQLRYVSSASDGTYAMPVLGAGNYYLSAELSGRVRTMYPRIACEEQCDVARGTSIAVAEGATKSGVDITLIHGGTLAGTLTPSTAARNIDRGGIYLTNAATGSVRFHQIWGSGAFQVSTLAPGSYYVRAVSNGFETEYFDDVKCGSNCSVLHGTPVVVADGETTTTNFVLDPAGLSVSGRVVDARSGAPVANVTVAISANSDTEKTDANGNYVISGRTWPLPEGFYTVTASSPGYVTQRFQGVNCPTACGASQGTPVRVSSTEPTTGIDFQLSPLVVTSISPTAGATTGGLEVTVRGRGFIPGSYVTFGGVNAETRFLSEGEIIVATPPHAEGEVSVEVHDPNGLVTPNVEPFTFMVNAPPPAAMLKDIATTQSERFEQRIGTIGAAADFLTVHRLVATDGARPWIWTPDRGYEQTEVAGGTAGDNGWHLGQLAASTLTVSRTNTKSEIFRVDRDGKMYFVASFTGGLQNVASTSDIVFFTHDLGTSRELWATKGTPASTERIAMLENYAYYAAWTAAEDGAVKYLATFNWNDPWGGIIWKSDGTAAGTQLVATLGAGTLRLELHGLAVVGPTLFFSATNGLEESGLFASDGTEAGTRLVRHFVRRIQAPVSFQGKIYFAAPDETGSPRLWISDGTTPGTAVAPSSPYEVRSLVVSGGRLYFTAVPALGSIDVELWSTDGTSTERVKDLVPGDGGSAPTNISPLRNGVLFWAIDATMQRRLCYSDGTSAGTFVFAEIVDYYGSSEKKIVIAGEQHAWIRIRNRIWHSDGTTGGTQLVVDETVRDGSSSSPDSITAISSTLALFAATDGVNGRELWATDGTAAGTRLVADIRAGAESSGPALITRFGDEAAFIAAGPDGSYRLWLSDGTEQGTRLFGGFPGSPRMENWNSVINTTSSKIFVAVNDYNTTTLAAADPTAVTFVSLFSGRLVSTWVASRELLFFVERDWQNDRVVIWRSDGTPGGTYALRVIPDADTAVIRMVGNRLYISAWAQGRADLWVSDGTVGGTVRVTQLSGTPAEIVNANGVASIFMVSNATLGLWLSEGTLETTRFATTIGPTAYSDLGKPTVSRGLIFFRTLTNSGDVEPWVTDGTATGTRPLRESTLGRHSSYPTFVKSAYGSVLFTAPLDGETDALWETRGTATTTARVADSLDRYHVSSFAIVGDQLLFSGTSERDGTELWAYPLSGRATFSSLSPTSGDSAGGTLLRVTGTSLARGMPFTLGDSSPANVEALSPTEATMTTRAMPAGKLLDLVLHEGNGAALPKAFFANFTDVLSTHPLQPFVEKIVRRDITGGCGGGLYCVSNRVTRAQMAIFLLRAKYPAPWMPPPATGTMFNDVPANGFAAAWIEELARQGITGGCGGGNFCPNSAVTRGSMAVMVLATIEGPGYRPPAATGMFADVPVSSPLAPWIEEFARRGISAGCGGGNFCPSSPTTRGQMAVFLTAAFGF